MTDRSASGPDSTPKTHTNTHTHAHAHAHAQSQTGDGERRRSFGDGGRLSGNVLKLKFMQQSKEKELREALMEEQKKESRKSEWVSKKYKEVVSKQPAVVYMESHPLLDPHASGRQSFGRFNTEIERLCHLQAGLRRQAQRRAQREVEAAAAANYGARNPDPNVSVSDADMAARLGHASASLAPVVRLSVKRRKKGKVSASENENESRVGGVADMDVGNKMEVVDDREDRGFKRPKFEAVRFMNPHRER